MKDYEVRGLADLPKSCPSYDKKLSDSKEEINKKKARFHIHENGKKLKAFKEKLVNDEGSKAMVPKVTGKKHGELLMKVRVGHVYERVQCDKKLIPTT